MNKHILLLFALGIFLISGCAQINRDNLRYSAIKRGYEVYRIGGRYFCNMPFIDCVR